MKIGLLVDSTCDLPRNYFDSGDVALMPISMQVGGQVLEDQRDETETLAFHRKMAEVRDENFADSMPYTAEAIEKLFLDRLVLEYDHVFCLTVTASRSQIYDNAMKASFGIVSKYREIRRTAGLSARFTLAVINSRNLFTGTAVLATEIVRMIREGKPPSEIDHRVREFVPHTYAYMVPPDLFHIYKRASRRGDKSLNWAGYTLGSVFDVKPILCGHMDHTGPVAKMRHFDPAVETMFANVTRAVKAGLMVPQVCIGFGGDPANVAHLPGYARLKDACDAREVALIVAPMSMAGGVHTGPGCVSVAFVSDKHQFEERI